MHFKEQQKSTDTYSAFYVQPPVAQSNIYLTAWFTFPPFLLTIDKQIFRATFPHRFQCYFTKVHFTFSILCSGNNLDFGITVGIWTVAPPLASYAYVTMGM